MHRRVGTGAVRPPAACGRGNRQPRPSEITPAGARRVDGAEPHHVRSGCCASHCSSTCSSVGTTAPRAAWLLGGLGATDWVDGYMARRFGQVSELGKMLDPTADRLLFIVGVGGIIIDGAAPLWVCVARRDPRGAARRHRRRRSRLMGMKRFDVTFLGKAATLVPRCSRCRRSCSAAATSPAHTVFQWLGWGFGIPGLVVSYYTAVKYIPILRQHLREGRARRADRREPAA